MTLQFSTTLRNNLASQFQATCGTSALLNVYSGSTVPSNPAASNTGSLIVSIPLPASFLAVSNGVATQINGPWQTDATASSELNANYFRILDSASNVHIQGTAGLSGSGADLILNTLDCPTGILVSIGSCTLTIGGS